jgi:hypothetical protein
MDLNLAINLDTLKGLPRRLKITVAIIAVEVILIGASFMLSDEIEEAAARVVQLRNQLTQVRQQNTNLRRQIDQYPELMRRFKVAVDKGIFTDLNRVKMVSDAETVANGLHLGDLRYKLELKDPQGGGFGKYRLGAVLISFESGALLDTEAMTFWDTVLSTVPAYYHVVDASLERAAEVDSGLLTNVRAGRPASAVRAKISFFWAGLRPPGQGEP